jgi:transposase
MTQAMQGLHTFDGWAKTEICLETFVPKDHFLRKVDRVLDLSFVRELTAPRYAASLGRPSIDPVVYFRIQLVGYLYGIRSERRLCEDVYCNLAYRWFCRLSPEDGVPDHSSFTNIRDRYGEEIFETVFCKIISQCQAKGLVNEDCGVMTDATLIAANASTVSMVPNEPEQVHPKQESPPGSKDPPDIPAKPKVSNRTHHSRTDPDATLARKDRTPLQLKYKVHQTIDAKSRVILDTHVTTGGVHDSQPYLEQLKRVGQWHKIRIGEATADRGYGSAAIIRNLQEQGIETYIPLWNKRSGNSKHMKGGFVYEKQKDRIRCPVGKFLTLVSTDDKHKRYSSSSSDCQACQQSATCSAERRKGYDQRHIRRNKDQELFEEVQARMRDPTFIQRRSERMWKSEGLFAEAKQNHNLARAKFRGRSKVQIQAYFSAIALNLKRLVAMFYYWLMAIWLRKNISRALYSACLSKTTTFSTRPYEFLGVSVSARKTRPAWEIS